MNTTNDPRRGWTSASNAGADRLCPGRHNAQKGMPDIKGEWADYGQHIHDALAHRDTGTNEFIDTLNSEQRDMFDACREVEKKVVTQIWGGEPEKNTRVWRHERYWAKVPIQKEPPFTTFFHHSGEADYVMRRGTEALILDYKVLSGEVPESPKNDQLRDLAIMVWRTLLVEEVIVAIIQPLETWSPELCRYTKADLERAEQEMWERVRKSNDPDAPRYPGAVQCKFCKAKGKCPEYAQWMAVMVPTMSDITTPVAQWTPEQRSIYCERRGVARQWLDDCDEQMKVLLQANPDSVPGWTLKEGNKREIINNPQELFNRFAALGGQLEQFMACVKITKGDLGDQVRAITKSKGKALKAQMETLVEGIVDVHQNSPSLAKKKEE